MNVRAELLYTYYLAGLTSVKGKESNVLQVAKSIGTDLTRQEFLALYDQVHELELENAESQNQEEFLQKILALRNETNQRRGIDFAPQRNQDNSPIVENDPNRLSVSTQDLEKPSLEQTVESDLGGKDRLKEWIQSIFHSGKNKDESIEPVQMGSTASSEDSSLEKMLRSVTNTPDESSGDNYSPHEEQPDSKSSGWVDAIQLGLDAVGVLEPTPFADLTNAGVSMVRAVIDPKHSGQHIKNAGLSIISTLPYLGDVAKLAKGYGKTGAKVGTSIESFASSKGAKILENVGSFLGVPNIAGGSGGVGGLFGGLFSGGGGNGGSGGGNLPAPSSAGGNFPNSLNSVFSGVVIAVGSTIAAFRLLNNWVNQTVESGRKLVEQNRDMAMYSSDMSVAMLNYDYRSVERRMRESNYLGSSGAWLAGSQANLEDAVSNYRSPYLRTANNIYTAIGSLAAIASNTLSYLDPIRNLLSLIYQAVDQNTENENETRNSIEEWIRQSGAIQDQQRNDKKVKLPADDKMDLLRAAMEAGFR